MPDLPAGFIHPHNSASPPKPVPEKCSWQFLVTAPGCWSDAQCHGRWPVYGWGAGTGCGGWWRGVEVSKFAGHNESLGAGNPLRLRPLLRQEASLVEICCHLILPGDRSSQYSQDDDASAPVSNLQARASGEEKS